MKCNGYKFQVSEESFIKEFGFHPPCFMTFPSFDDYLRVGDIEKVMSNLYGEESVRENENEFYNHLQKMEIILKDCSKMDFSNDDNGYIIFHQGFPCIDSFLLETEFKKFKHNNNRLENKFYEIKDLLCEKGINSYM